MALTAVALFALLPFGSSQASVQVSATLTVAPLTWNVIGLDSNQPTAGPKRFPVGARVCSSVATTNVGVNFVFDSANANINLRPGSLTSITIPSLAAGQCADAYFEAEVTQVAAAYDTKRRYHITATDASGTASTPIPRELYVEHLISQNRNGITDMKLNGVSIPAGGAMNLLIGNTYTIELDGFTATQGYNQLESFINFPNTIFQILSVSTTYSADSNPSQVPNPNDKLYADACVWENDPTSPNYRSCVGGDDKAGGTVAVTYTIRIIGGGGTSQTLNTLFYDFSGSSFHYNGDFVSSARIANVVDPAALTISKAFSPGSTVAGGLSTLTFTITYPSAATIGGVNFTDPLPTSPGAMTVANPPNASTSGCGAPTFSPSAGAASLSFSNGTLAPNGTCTASVSVSVPASPTSGTYNNTSNDLFVNTLDTGHHASASLTLTAAVGGTGLCGLTLARWDFPSGASATNPAPSQQAGDVLTASAAAVGITPIIETTATWGNPPPEWGGRGFPTANARNLGLYFQFSVDTSKYTGVAMAFDAFRRSNGPDRFDLFFGTGGTPSVGTQKGGTPYTTLTTADTRFPVSADFTGQTSTSGATNFFVLAYNASNNGADAFIYLDNATFTGCGTAQPPTLGKAFSPNPIAVNAVSTLTFTLANSNTAPLTGVKFTDSLPAGLAVAATPAASTTCGGSPSWAPAAGATTLNFGQSTGATIPASGSCAASVNIQATTSGPHTNVSGFISSTESGTNSGAGGSATASLTALQPPSISKLFGPNPILSGGTSTLTFLIANPNPNDSLPAVAFSDTFPLSPGAMTVASPPNASASGCGSSPALTAVAGAGSISFSNGTISAGATCTVKVDVTAAAAGDYANTSGAVSTTIAGVLSTGNTASDTLTVNAPHPAIGLRKAVSTNASGPWTTFVSEAPGTNVFYQFTIENTGDVPLSPVSVTDPTVSTASCTWPATLPVASPTQDPTATCVVGPVTVLAGDHPNTATAHGTFGGTVFNSSPSSADYIGAVPGFSLLKQISTSASGPWASAITVAPGSDLFYKFTVVNTGNVALTGVNVTDVQVSTAGCTFTDPLPVNDATTCVVGPVTASTISGTHTNTATAHGTNGGTTIDSPPSSASYDVVLPTPTPTNTPTDTPTSTPTNTPTDTPTSTPTNTPTNTPTSTPTSTPTTTPTPTDTPTNTPSNTPSNTPTVTPTATPTQTNTPSPTPTDTPTSTPTSTPTNIPTNTPTATPSSTNTPTSTPTNTPTSTPTSTPTNTPTSTPTNTPTSTATSTPTSTPANTPVIVPTNTPTNAPTPSVVDVPTLDQTGMLLFGLLIAGAGLLLLRRL